MVVRAARNSRPSPFRTSVSGLGRLSLMGQWQPCARLGPVSRRSRRDHVPDAAFRGAGRDDGARQAVHRFRPERFET